MKTVSDKQLAANRANAAKSTGPRTSEGKARAAANSRKHGLIAAAVSILRMEDKDELDNLRAGVYPSRAVARYQPRDSQEMFAVERIAVCQLTMVRGWRLEAGMFITCLDRVLNDDGTSVFPLHADLFPDRELHMAQNQNYAMAEGFQRMATQSPMWSLLLRYQAQAERQYRRAVEDFQRLVRERRDDFPNEPISGSQPDETKPETPLPDEPIDEPIHQPVTPAPSAFPVPGPDRRSTPSPAANSIPEAVLRVTGVHPPRAPEFTRRGRLEKACTFLRPGDPRRASAGSSSGAPWRSGLPDARTRSGAPQGCCPTQPASGARPGQPDRGDERPLTGSFYLDLTSGAVRAAGAPVIIRPSRSKRISYA